MQTFQHTSVLMDEAMALLDPQRGGVYVDGTLGGGGHAAAVLERAPESSRLLGIELAFARGAATVFAIDPVETRRSHAGSLGAVPLHPDTARDQIREQTKGAACDSIFEASGARGAIGLVPSLARHGATASFIGLPQGDTAVPMRDIIYRNLTVRAGVANVVAQWDTLVPLLQSGRVKGRAGRASARPALERASAA